MKKIASVLVFLAIATVNFSCDDDKDNDNRYLDLSSGDPIELKEDDDGLMVNAETGKTVRIYVDTEENDTIWGRTGKVINGRIIKTDDDEWEYEDDEEYKRKSKDDLKVSSEDDEYKVKNGDYKKEVEKDGDITIKDGDTKIKIDGKTGERKVKKDD